MGEKNWGCGRWREEGEKTKQKEPNHHILVREQPGNKLKNPKGQGVGPLSFECNVLLIHFIAYSRCRVVVESVVLVGLPKGIMCIFPYFCNRFI